MEKCFKGRLTNRVDLSINLYSIPKKSYFSGGGEKEMLTPLNKTFKPFLIRKPALKNIQPKYC